MNSITDLIDLMQEVLELPITEQDINIHFDCLDGWDSLHILRLITSIEAETGQKIAVASILQARNIQEIYQLVS
ncbi:MAG: acyl carrier protein [Xenococcaceae cyanobacterium MO_167.B27]|nr:acyl carrier protein [Xenococcaceae cyanobacterium MO_167.B27]